MFSWERTDMEVMKKDSEGDSSREIKEYQLEEGRGRRGGGGGNDGQMVTEGTGYSLVLVQSFLCVGSFPLHRTLGADNRWSYHYCKTHNPHSNSLRLCCV